MNSYHGWPTQPDGTAHGVVKVAACEPAGNASRASAAWSRPWANARRTAASSNDRSAPKPRYAVSSPGRGQHDQLGLELQLGDVGRGGVVDAVDLGALERRGPDRGRGRPAEDDDVGRGCGGGSEDGAEDGDADGLPEGGPDGSGGGVAAAGAPVVDAREADVVAVGPGVDPERPGAGRDARRLGILADDRHGARVDHAQRRVRDPGRERGVRDRTA